MKKILMSILILSAFNSSAQVPGTPYHGFEFTNGSLADTYSLNGNVLVNGVNQTVTLDTDRYGVYGNAIDSSNLIGVGTPNVEWLNTSISFWVKRSTNYVGNEELISLRNGNGLGYSISLKSTKLVVEGKCLVVVNDPASITEISDSCRTGVWFGSQNGQYLWHHVVVTFNHINYYSINDAIEVNIYIDNVKRLPRIWHIFSLNPYPITNFLNNTTLRINQNNDFLGSVDDIYLYNSVLSPSDVNVLYSNLNTPTLVNSINVSGANGISSISNITTSTLQMQAAVLPINSTNGSYSWSVVNGTGSATINSNGILTAVTNGDVTVIATSNDASGVYGSKQISISGVETQSQLMFMRAQLNDSVDTIIDNVDINIYPNPSKEVLNFSSDTYTSVSIYNLNGQKIIESNNVLSLNIKSLQKGVYFIKIYKDHNNYVIKRLVKE